MPFLNIFSLFVTYGNKRVALICLFKLEGMLETQEYLYFYIWKEIKIA